MKRVALIWPKIPGDFPKIVVDGEVEVLLRESVWQIRASLSHGAGHQPGLRASFRYRNRRRSDVFRCAPAEGGVEEKSKAHRKMPIAAPMIECALSAIGISTYAKFQAEDVMTYEIARFSPEETKRLALYGSQHEDGRVGPTGSKTKYISSESFRSVRRAIVQAFCMGRPLNYFITIHVEAAGVDRYQDCRKRVMSRMSEWLARRIGFPACYIWVCENPPADNGGFGGWHIHLVANVPPELRKQLRRGLKRWIKNAGGTLKKGVLNTKPVEHSDVPLQEELYLRHGIWGLARYVGKGIDPDCASEFDIVCEFQGIITGKRAGYSEALGRKHCVPPGLLTGEARRRRRLIKAACPELLGLLGAAREPGRRGP